VDTEAYLVHSCHRTKVEWVPHTLLLPLAADIEGTGPRPARDATPTPDSPEAIFGLCLSPPTTAPFGMLASKI
jgi:hypothetical protein